MDFKQIQELIKLINKTNVSEVKIEEKDFKITIRSKSYTEAIQAPHVPINLTSAVQTAPMAMAPVPPSAPAAQVESGEKASEDSADSEAHLITIKSPMIGTFYRSSAPDKDPFIKVGTSIEKGSVICIVEAMKLFNEIESEVSGQIVKVLIDDASPVEYDQPIFLVDPS